MELKEIRAIARKFHSHGFTFTYFPRSNELKLYLQQLLQGKTIGFGDSRTLWDLDLYNILSKHNDVVDPMHPAENASFKEMGRCCLNRDVFISSANAITADGYLANMDGTGNRVAGTLFGADEVYFIVGRNKLTSNLEEAILRVRNVAAPLNTKRKHLNTPCARLEPHCYDCQAQDRICNALVIYYHKMRNVNKMEVILVDEDLGF